MFLLIPDAPDSMGTGVLYKINLGTHNKILAITYHGLTTRTVWQRHDSLVTEKQMVIPIEAVQIQGYTQELTIGCSPVLDLPPTLYHNIHVGRMESQLHPFEWFEWLQKGNPAEVGDSDLTAEEFRTIIEMVKSSDYDTCLLGLRIGMSCAQKHPEIMLNLYYAFSANDLWKRNDYIGWGTPVVL